MTSAIAATPIPFLVGEGVLYATSLDPTAIGQGVLAVLVIGAYVVQRRGQNDAKARQEEIHVLVNSRLTEALSEITQLKIRLDAKDKVIAEADLAREEAARVIAQQTAKKGLGDKP